MKKIFTMTMLVASSAAFSQGLIGPKLGLNINNFRDAKVSVGNTVTDYESILAPQAGIVFNAKLGDIISLRPELLYIQRGYKTKTPSASYTTRLSYAELPFNVVGCIPAGPGKVEISVGPAVGYMFDGRQKKSGGDPLITGPNEIAIKGEDMPKTPEVNTAYMNYLNVSLNFGVGYNWKGLIFQVGYNLGLSNTNPHYEDRESPAEKNRDEDVTKSSAVTFGLTYLFGGKEE